MPIAEKIVDYVLPKCAIIESRSYCVNAPGRSPILSELGGFEMSYGLTMGEFAILTATDVLVCGAGYVTFRWWTGRGHTPPVWLVSCLMVASLFVFVGVTRHLWINADPVPLYGEQWARELGIAAQSDTLPGSESLAKTGSSALSETPRGPSRLMTVLIFCLAFWTVPVAYFSNVFVQSVATRVVERRALIEMEIPDSDAYPEVEGFYEAKELALLGNVEGAVHTHSHSRKRIRGCFAAARLLEADGRYPEAAELLRELVRQTQQEERPWAEASYRLANLYQKHLERRSEAVDFYNKIVLRMPETEYGRMASKALRHLNPGGDALLDALDAAFETEELSGSPSVDWSPGAGRA